MDYGRITLDSEYVIYMFNVIPNYLPEIPWGGILPTNHREQCLGHVLLVDSAYVPHFFIARNLIEAYEETDIPYIVACNKQDLAGAWSPEDLRIALEVPDEVPVVPCIATDRNTIPNTLIRLCEEVLRCQPCNS